MGEHQILRFAVNNSAMAAYYIKIMVTVLLLIIAM